MAAGRGAVSAYLAGEVLARPYEASIVGRHIVYASCLGPGYTAPLIYIGATSLPLLLSSQTSISALGAVVLLGCAISYGFYEYAFTSVWCFFSAAASVMILLHFRQAFDRRLLPQSA